MEDKVDVAIDFKNLPRAKWVKGQTPKKHGAFEGVYRGDDVNRPHMLYWTGRRWMVQIRELKKVDGRLQLVPRWVDSVFGSDPGDRWRGLKDDPYASKESAKPAEEPATEAATTPATTVAE